MRCNRGVAQLGSALGSGPRGREFKSRRLDHVAARQFLQEDGKKVPSSLLLCLRLLFPKISPRVACEIFGNAVRGGGARFFARGIATERRRDDRTFDRVCKCARTNRPIGGYIDNSEFPCYHNDDHLQGEIVQLCQSIRKGVWDEKIYFRDSSLLCVCRWFVYRIGRGTDVVRSRLKKRKILCR